MYLINKAVSRRFQSVRRGGLQCEISRTAATLCVVNDLHRTSTDEIFDISLKMKAFNGNVLNLK